MRELLTNPNEFGFLADYLRWEDDWGRKTLENKIKETKKIKKMYRPRKVNKTSMKVNESYEGETLEYKIQRLVKNKEPLEGSVPLTYTERKDGVRPELNIRTDRWEIAADAMDKVAKSNIAKRDNKGEKPNKGEETKPTGEAEKSA